MYLPDEAVDVWKPVQAEKLGADAKPNLFKGVFSAEVRCECPLQPTDVPKADGLLPARCGDVGVAPISAIQSGRPTPPKRTFPYALWSAELGGFRPVRFRTGVRRDRSFASRQGLAESGPAGLQRCS
jgi:hypothetical protein